MLHHLPTNTEVRASGDVLSVFLNLHVLLDHSLQVLLNGLSMQFLQLLVLSREVLEMLVKVAALLLRRLD